MNRKALRALRESIGYRGAVAKQIGVTMRQLARWELGERPIPPWVELALVELKRRAGKKRSA